MFSFNNLKQWIVEVERYASASVTKLIVGNFADDNNRVVSYETAKEFADSVSKCLHSCIKVTE